MLNLYIAESLTTTILLLCAYAITATITEVGQAWFAHKLGDDTAAEEGWLDLDPLTHIDLIGVLFVVFLNFAWVRVVPINPYFARSARKIKLAAIYFSQAAISLLFAIILLVLLRFWLGQTCIQLLVSMFGSAHAPLKDILKMYPERSSLSILASLFMISLVFYSIFIATISLIANGFRFFYTHIWQTRRLKEEYPDYVIWIAGLILILFIAEPVRRMLLELIIKSSSFIGFLFGTH